MKLNISQHNDATRSNKKKKKRPGFYILKGAVRSDGNGAYITANNNSSEIPVFGGEGKELGKGWGWLTVPCVVSNSGVLKIGCKTGKGWDGTWYSVDDFSLRYYPAVSQNTIGEVDETSVFVFAKDGYINVVGGEATAVFTTSGISVPLDTKLEIGYYFVIANGKTYKVAVQ